MKQFKPAAILLAFCLAAAPAVGAESGDAAKSGAADSAPGQNGGSPIPKSVEGDLERFRQWSAAQSEKAVASARAIMADLRRYAEQAEAKLESAGADAKARWEETRKAFQGYLDEAEARLEDLKTAANDTWSHTRDAVAKALEDAAASLENDTEKHTEKDAKN